MVPPSTSSSSLTTTKPRRSLTDGDLPQQQHGHDHHDDDCATSVSPRMTMGMGNNEDATMEDVARIMREEDAHLLESMHFEQSCSTGETPVLTSQLAPYHPHLDDIPPLQFEAPIGEPLSSLRLEDSALAAGVPSSPTPSSSLLGQPIDFQRQLSLQSAQSDTLSSDQQQHQHPHSDVVYRQCLSGEIKSYRKEPADGTTTATTLPASSTATSPTKSKPPPPPQQQQQTRLEEPSIHSSAASPMEDDAAPEGEETTISSTSEIIACGSPSLSLQSSIVEQQQQSHQQQLQEQQQRPIMPVPVDVQKRRKSSNDRRLNEAVQFAQAVGEMPPMDSNELCIIEEDDDDDTDDDDDNDDGNGTVIRLDEISSLHDHLSLVGGDNASALYPGDTSLPSATSETNLAATPTNLVHGGEEQPPIPREIVKRKSRPRWPLQLPGWTFSHLDNSNHGAAAPHESMVQDYVYKGIHSNPPEIVKRGMSRGNHVQLHRKAWLEVSDKYHRYGKNLRLYYRYWESLGYPTNMFFDWLDSKGEAAGRPLPHLDDCPRAKLDSDTVLYITNPDVTKGYALSIVTVDGRCRFIDVDGELVRTGPDGWIFVLRDGIIYGAEKITSINGQSKQRFHHSSFFGGKAVAAAGIIITDDEGFLTRLYPHSGHYRPREAHMQRLLYFLYHEGVDLRTFEMDIQQIMHVARDAVDDNKDKEKNNNKESSKENSSSNNNEKDIGKSNHDKKEGGGEKKKKIDSLQLMPAVSVACYVAHKAHFIGEGIFAQIHQIRNADVASVTEALAYVKGKRKKDEMERPVLPEGTVAEEA